MTTNPNFSNEAESQPSSSILVRIPPEVAANEHGHKIRTPPRSAEDKGMRRMRIHTREAELDRTHQRTQSTKVSNSQRLTSPQPVNQCHQLPISAVHVTIRTGFITKQQTGQIHLSPKYLGESIFER